MCTTNFPRGQGKKVVRPAKFLIIFHFMERNGAENGLTRSFPRQESIMQGHAVGQVTPETD